MIEDLIYCCFRFDRARVLPHLPPHLTPVEGNVGIAGFYRHGPGWGLADVALAFFSVAVEEYPAPDTAEACVYLGGYVQPKAQPLVAGLYGPFQPGETTVTQDGDRIWGEVQAGGQTIAHCRIRLNTGLIRGMGSSDRYLGIDAQGALVSSVISVTGDCYLAELEMLEFTASAPPALQALQPVALDWAGFNPRILANWSAPEVLRLPPGAGLAGPEALLALFNGEARGAAILTVDGQMRQANARARSLLEGAPLRILPAPGSERVRFRTALAAAAQGQAAADDARFLVPVPGQPRPLMAQVLPVDPRLAGTGTALVLLSDLSARGTGQDAGLLQLLGLTPSEARIAAAVGAGLPPREAASELGLAESTVRSSLKAVYGKLGLTRQAELTRLIARLEV